jgi:hypothetical protein
VVIAIAAASSITPVGDDLLATSTNVSFSVGPASVTCTLGQFWGTIQNPKASTMSIGAPLFKSSNGTECTTGAGGKTVVSTFGTWTFRAFGTTEAGLTLPSTEVLLLHPEPSCTVYNNGEGTPAGAWIAGAKESPVSRSALVLSKATIPVKVEGVGCAAKTKEATTMTVSASFIFNDTTNRESVIKFE